MTVDDCRLIDLPKILDNRGNLSFVQNDSQIPFEIKRTFWLYDVPGGECRGGHAYYYNQEFVIALSGSFDVVVDDGTVKRVISLNRSYFGLYIPNGLWREMNNFSTNAFALEFASTPFLEEDYIRDYDRYVMMRRNGQL